MSFSLVLQSFRSKKNEDRKSGDRRSTEIGGKLKIRLSRGSRGTLNRVCVVILSFGLSFWAEFEKNQQKKCHLGRSCENGRTETAERQ